MLRVILGSIFAAVLMFGWGYVVWGILASEIQGKFRPYQRLPVDNLEAFSQATEGLEPGTYLHPPYPESAEEEEAFKKVAETTPWLILHYSPTGSPGMTKAMAFGFGHMLAVAFLLGSLLRIAAPALRSYSSRISFVTCIGLIAAVFIDGGDIIWYHQDMGHYFFMAGYHVVSFLLAGLILGALVRPETA